MEAIVAVKSLEKSFGEKRVVREISFNVKTFSGEMKRRLNIACAIVHEPELLIME